ncbi:MAG: glucose-6-phosphate isomerase [Gemmatimonadota bacterium]
MLRLDYTFMLADVVDGGVSVADWTAAASAFRAAHSAVGERVASGELGFVDLPRDRSLLEQSLSFAAGVAGRYRDVVVLGIGGSALGPIALRTALRPPLWNQLDEKERGGWPRLHVLDNVDPLTISAVLAKIEVASTLFVVTSKSGGTAETMAQYLVVRDYITSAGRAPANHLVFVTDPAKGALRPIAVEGGIPALDIPANVGGRFSVLSPVGMLPAALIGIDCKGLLDGAADMVKRCAAPDVTLNPAGAFATLQWLSDTRCRRPIHVMMPYSDRLRDMSAWFVQLWAESLGKRLGESGVGPTPLAALGATDQHSQVQLFMEGPQDKTVTFMAVEEGESDRKIPAAHSDVPDLAYLAGHTLFELLNSERRATAAALAARGRPSATVYVDRVDPWHVGSLIMFLELATAYAGSLYGVNAFDQPGVELGKRFTYGMMGRPGFADAAAELSRQPASSRDRVVS